MLRYLELPHRWTTIMEHSVQTHTHGGTSWHGKYSKQSFKRLQAYLDKVNMEKCSTAKLQPEHITRVLSRYTDTAIDILSSLVFVSCRRGGSEV